MGVELRIGKLLHVRDYSLGAMGHCNTISSSNLNIFQLGTNTLFKKRKK